MTIGRSSRFMYLVYVYAVHVILAIFLCAIIMTARLFSLFMTTQPPVRSGVASVYEETMQKDFVLEQRED